MEPAEIKRFRSKLTDRKIVVATKANYREISGYVLNKHGISILSTLKAIFAPEQPEQPEQPEPLVTAKAAPKTVRL